MIILSVHKFSQLPSFAGTESLPVPMLLRGFGVGLLNVSVTIAVLMYFHAGQRLEGIANFLSISHYWWCHRWSRVLSGNPKPQRTSIRRDWPNAR